MLVAVSIAYERDNDASQPTEVQLTTAYLVNFLKFVDWDVERAPAPQAPFVVAIMGDDELASAATTAFKSHTVNGHPIVARAAAHAGDAHDAHLVFVGGAEASRVASIVGALEGRGVLTVANTPGFAQAGVVLNLYVAGGRMRFEVNTAAAARARVRLSSQLLRLARVVG